MGNKRKGKLKNQVKIIKKKQTKMIILKIIPIHRSLN